MILFKNVASQKVAVFAVDRVTGEGKTGDAANITAEISIGGGASAATNDVNPTELDATDHPGVYLFDLTQAETNGDLIVITPVSTTANIVFEPRSLIVPTKTELTAANVLAGVIEGTITLKQVLQAVLAFVAGLTNGAATATLNFRNNADSKNRIQMTVDSDGDRSAVSLDFD